MYLHFYWDNQIYICNPVKKNEILTGAPGGPDGPLGPIKPWESESESKHEWPENYYDECWPIKNVKVQSMDTATVIQQKKSLL